MQNRYQNSEEEFSGLPQSFEENCLENFIQYCNGLARNLSETITGTGEDRTVFSGLEDTYTTLKESLLATIPRCDIEISTNSDTSDGNQRECKMD